MAGKKTLIKKILRASNLSNTDSHFKKTVLLTSLEEDLSTATIPESMLETLEVIEEVNRREGSPISAAMCTAYCAIAVECTLKYLQVEVSISKNPAYLEAIKRIWWGRVGYMKPSASGSGEGSLLFSTELKRWNSDIEASLVDSQLRERFAGMNTRRDAIHRLKAYLAEAWADLGPSFLELAASLPVTTNKGFAVSGAQPTTKEGTDLGTATRTNDLDGHHEELGVTSDKGPFFSFLDYHANSNNPRLFLFYNLWRKALFNDNGCFVFIFFTMFSGPNRNSRGKSNYYCYCY